MSLVLDASTTIAWFFDDERTEASQAILRRVTVGGAVTPSLWRLEVANVFRNAVRRGRCDETYVDRSLARLDRLAIHSDEETDRHAWSSTLTLSRQEALTPYDAAYLELAIRRRLPLASRDTALMAAAAGRGVEVLST